MQVNCNIFFYFEYCGNVESINTYIIKKCVIELVDKSHPMKMSVWRTIPLVEDEYVSGTDSVIAGGGLM